MVQVPRVLAEGDPDERGGFRELQQGNIWGLVVCSDGVSGRYVDVPGAQGALQGSDPCNGSKRLPLKSLLPVAMPPQPPYECLTPLLAQMKRNF